MACNSWGIKCIWFGLRRSSFLGPFTTDFPQGKKVGWGASLNQMVFFWRHKEALWWRLFKEQAESPPGQLGNKANLNAKPSWPPLKGRNEMASLLTSHYRICSSLRLPSLLKKHFYCPSLSMELLFILWDLCLFWKSPPHDELAACPSGIS